MILCVNYTSIRLIEFFRNKIKFLHQVNKSEKFNKVFLTNTQVFEYDLSNHCTENTTLFVDFCTESGNFHKSFEQIKNHIKKLYKCNIVYIVDNIGGNIKKFEQDNNVEIFSSRYFTFYSYLTFTSDSFSLFMNNQYSKVLQNIEIDNREKLFTSRNGRFTDYRFYLIYKLLETYGSIESLTNNGLVSALFYTDSISCVRDLKMIEKKYIDNINFDFYKAKVKPHLPIKYDKFLKEGGTFLDIRGDLHYSSDDFNTYFDIVTENTVNDDLNYQICTITEKSLKPFIGLQVPIIISQKKTYSYLKELGFDLFDDLLGTDYYEYDVVKKIDYFVDFIHNISMSQMKEYYKNNFYRIENNRNVLIDLAFIKGKQDLNKFLQKYDI